MKLIRTHPQFRCDFCRFRATAPTVEKHEKICWLNPNRYCPTCKNKGSYVEVYGDLVWEGDGGLHQEFPCPYCSKFRTKEEWEKSFTPIPEAETATAQVRED